MPGWPAAAAQCNGVVPPSSFSLMSNLNLKQITLFLLVCFGITVLKGVVFLCSQQSFHHWHSGGLSFL